MNPLSLERCFNHPLREAAARCPQCTRHFCRECITEHDDRVICAKCLERLAAAGGSRARTYSVASRFIQLTLGLLIAWAAFNLLGNLLLIVPARYHDGTFLDGPRPEDSP